MKIKYSFMTFFSNFAIHILIILEIFVLLTAVNISVASIRSRTMLYNPLKPYLQKNGFYACSVSDENIDASKLLSNTASIINCRAYYDERIGYTIINDEIFDKLDLPLKSGRKFNAKSKDPYPQLIVSSNNAGFKKGDIITDANGQKYKISAVLTDLSYYLDFNRWSIEMTYKDFYYPLDIKYDDTPLFYTSESQVRDISGIRSERVSSGMIVNYPNDTSDEIIKKDMETLSQFGLVTANREILTRSQAEIKDDIKKMLPPVILFGIIVMLGIISCAIITAQKNMGKLAVFCLCGSSRTDCIWINCGNMMISVLIASALSAVTLLFISVSSLPYKYGLVFSLNNLYVFLIINTLILGISIAVTLRIISKKKIYALICNSNSEKE